MKVPPASAKRSSWAWATFSSDSLPKVIVPRQYVETAHPLRPSVRYSMGPTYESQPGPADIGRRPEGPVAQAEALGALGPPASLSLPVRGRANHIRQQRRQKFGERRHTVAAEYRLGVELDPGEARPTHGMDGRVRLVPRHRDRTERRRELVERA